MSDRYSGEGGSPRGDGLHSLPAGTKLGEFEVVSIVGEGGFAIVYLAIDQALGRRVAIKEYMPTSLATREGGRSVIVSSERTRETFQAGLRSFINEARILAQFDHPALVKVYRFWEENNTAYMAMPYYSGHTLKRVLGDTPQIVTEAWLKTILVPILDTLEILHRAKVYHRDISLDNVLIQNGGMPLLLDFGAARRIVGDMTHTLTAILKPGYAPIEQYASDPDMVQGPWTDIYALSAMLYFLITKSQPANSVTRIMRDSLQALTDAVTEGYSRSFLEAIDAGLAVRPEARPQSIEEFRKLLGLGSAIANIQYAATIGLPSSAAMQASSTVSASANELQTIAVPGVANKSDKFQFKDALQKLRLPFDRIVEAKRRRKHLNAAVPIPASNIQKTTMVTNVSRSLALFFSRMHFSSLRLSAGSYGIGIRHSLSNRLPERLALSKRRSADFLSDLIEKSREQFALENQLIRAKSNAMLLSCKSAYGKFFPSVFEGCLKWLSNHRRTVIATASIIFTAALAIAIGMLIPDTVESPVNNAAPSKMKAPATTPTPENSRLSDDSNATEPAPTTNAAQPEEPVEPGTGSVRFAIKPWGLVMVDGVSKGASPPLKSLELKEGRHKIDIVNPGSVTHSLRVEIRKDQVTVINYEFK